MKHFSPSTLAHILLLFTVFIWGATFPLVKDALTDVSPLLFNLIRMALATAVLVVINQRHLRTLNRQSLIAGLVVGLFLATGYQFQTAGLAHTTAIKSAFITGLVVVFVPLLLAIPMLRPTGIRAPGWNAAFGALFAFTGLLFLTTPPGTGFNNLFATISTGDLLSLACAVAFAGHLLALTYYARRVPISHLATLQIATATLVMAATIPLGGPVHITLTPRLIIALAVTSLLATAAAFTIQSWSQQHLPATHTAVLLTLEPVFAWLTSLLFLHEHLNSRSLLGATLILFGIACSELLAPAAPVPVYPS